mgnify:CR=1 FL=1
MQQKIAAFTAWLDSNHFYRAFDLVEIPGQGVGGVAKQAIKTDELLLKCPLSKMVFSNDHRIPTETVRIWSDTARN